ncbi:endonuclease/exonuclease/phosphatase family protein [Rhodobacteraceae bacterium]|nr:endonuclease/exonuclease/phosphatase family protein [Paracoccaceae bacterium]
MLKDILSGDDPQVQAITRVIRAADADILVLAGFDYDLHGVALNAFATALGGYPYRFARRPNRGRPSGLDLNGDGKFGGAEDAWGFGEFQGQGALAVLSRWPIDGSTVRDFTATQWTALPHHQALSTVPDTHPLSTTAHWDVPVMLPGGVRLNILVWHATPPVFDGPEDRNGRRNHDETAFWLAYLDRALPQPPPQHFVLAGVANLDPVDGDGRTAALDQLLAHPAVQDLAPKSAGGVEAANDDHTGDPALDTADWPEGPNRPGNLRVDYVLPSATLSAKGAGVFWPVAGASLRDDVETASRHRLVWVDIEMPNGLGDSD